MDKQETEKFKTKQLKEVNQNYQMLEKIRKQNPQIIQRHYGKYALIQNKEIKGYFSTRRDAREAAIVAFGEKAHWSIQQMINKPEIDLGFQGIKIAQEIKERKRK